MKYYKNKFFKLLIGLFLSIFIVVITAILYVLNITDAQNHDGEIINIAGKQRMYSLLISKNLNLYKSEKKNSKKEIYKNSINEYKNELFSNHELLLNQENSVKIDSMLKNIEDELQNIRFYTENIFDTNEYSLNFISKINKNEIIFLNKMNEIVKEYEKEYINKQSHFINIFFYSSIVVLIFLIIMMVFVFIPLIKKDISNRNELERTIHELKLLNHTKNTFFKIIAHDLKNPFGTIMSLLDFLKTDFENFTRDEINTFIDKISEQSNATYHLLTNLLEWAKLQSNEIAFKPFSVKLKDIFENVYIETKSLAENKDITLKFPKIDDVKIYADPYMIMATLRNLINNAIKFSENNTEINVYYEVHHNKIEFIVCDQGIGMEKDKIKDLFRIDSSKSTKGTSGELGSGLGLVLCKDYVEKHRGEISVESKLNKGSKFKFSIPIS